jgi:four helix bundle protein
MHFDRLDVYRLSIEYVGVSRPLVERLRRADGPMSDQLQRAVLSIACNVAEGAGEFSPGDKARLYRYALRSATESIAIVDAAAAIGQMKTDEHEAVRGAGIRLVAMLTRLVIVNADKRVSGTRNTQGSTRGQP